MPIQRASSSAPVSQTSTPSTPASKLPRAWTLGKPHRPDIAMWSKLREDLFQKSGGTPTHKATMADVDRVIARAEKNGVSPKELLALISIKSTQHMYFEGGSDSAAWKKLNAFTQDHYYAPEKRIVAEFDRRAGKGKLDVAGAKKLIEWVRDENTTQGAVVMKRVVAQNASRITPDAKAQLDAFLAKVELPAGWGPR
jgi:hypothetical protein